jgi:hypothetical protein
MSTSHTRVYAVLLAACVSGVIGSSALAADLKIVSACAQKYTSHGEKAGTNSYLSRASVSDKSSGNLYPCSYVLHVLYDDNVKYEGAKADFKCQLKWDTQAERPVSDEYVPAEPANCQDPGDRCPAYFWYANTVGVVGACLRPDNVSDLPLDVFPKNRAGDQVLCQSSSLEGK